MRGIVLIVAAFIIKIHSVSGQDFKFPVIKSKGQKITDFIPNDWKLVDTVSADLNRDVFKDIVFIENRDERFLNTESFQHFILVIAFFDNINNEFSLIEQCNNLITYSPSEAGPWYEEMQITNGIFEISFYKGGRYRSCIQL